MSSQTWYRSLDELENSPEFTEFMHREFPRAASEFPQGVSRRRWLQLMGASLALGGLAGCRFEKETLAPFSMRPANRIPGKPQHFNTTIEIAGQPQALRSTSYDGRPIKLDGNPDHPSSGGASTSFAQATVLELYDPDRGRAPREQAGLSSLARSWDEVDEFLAGQAASWKTDGGAKLAVLAEPTASPTVQRLRAKLQQQYPQMQWFEYASLSDENARQGALLAYGETVKPHFDLEAAAVILAIDCDLLGSHPDGLRHSRGFARGRQPEPGRMNRLYAVECEFSTTGVAADHRLALRSGEIAGLLADVAAQLELNDEQPAPQTNDDYQEKFVAALVDDLQQHRGKSVIAVGPQQPAEVHALAFRLNELLGNIGSTVKLTRDSAPKSGTIAQFVSFAQNGKCETVLVLGGNPSYDAPADVDFAQALAKVPHRVHLSLYPNETSTACNWYLPLSHPLESWTDTRLYDGTYGLGQPLLAPLFESRSTIELLGELVEPGSDALSLIRTTAEANQPGVPNDKAWNRLVHDGFLADSAAQAVTPKLQNFTGPAVSHLGHAAAPVNGDLELVFSSASNALDGRYANNAWLQELPHPLTKLTWGNAAVMSPQTAQALGVKDHDMVRLESGGQSVELPAYILPGQATGSVCVALGYGRTHAGLVGGSLQTGVAPVGVDIGKLRTSQTPGFVGGLTVTKTGRTQKLAATQDHYAIDKIGLEGIHGRIGDLIRQASLDEFEHHPDFAQHKVHHPPLESLWTEKSYDGHAWGMAIDLNKCVGCNACMIACQAENNVPVVGPDQVRANREMHWIRVDRYFAGDPEQPEVVTQPVTCQHCENAPCEQVCPVAATVHSDEGLNDMAYNRCIGTRYCGNNCPYKVRRFNFLDYRAEQPATNRDLTHLVLNPEVTVRSRGVMEKCTYCVQRIQNARIDAKGERRPLEPNEIMTACQQVCPAEAIVFGDLNNPASGAAQAHADPRAYALLGELNVKPRTKYLARIRNPHPWLAVAKSTDDHGHHSPDHHPPHDDHSPHQEAHGVPDKQPVKKLAGKEARV